MKLFRCTCETAPVLYFENVLCGCCGRLTGFCAESMELKPFEACQAGAEVPGQADVSAAASANGQPVSAVLWQDDDGKRYRQCANWTNYQVCNWMLPEEHDDKEGLCEACRLNDIIPDLGVAANLPLWHSLEKAKRRCIFTLLELGLPLNGRAELPSNQSGGDVEGQEIPQLTFRFMSDKDSGSHFQKPLEGKEPVLTGHADGVITINLAEADDIAITRMRVAMEERYRTLLGHFRHETGHYYWDVFNRTDSRFAERFRAAFGDEQASYSEALDRHYQQGPPLDWQNTFVSTYATMHPWEDWAETWAHYLHIIDTLETQQSYSLVSDMLSKKANQVDLPFSVGNRETWGASKFSSIMKLWIDVSIFLNNLNRSMGLPDPYPFVLHQPIQDKLNFVHETILRYIKR